MRLASRSTTFVLSALLFAPACATQRSAVRDLAARELACPEDAIDLGRDEGKLYRATGCGMSIRIACHDPHDSTGAAWGWADPLTAGNRVVCERVGADALPIVALISFLFGMILAFQSAVPMRRYGAEIFVADLIGIGMVREMGTLITAILLAGRSGAAFAAEIGTMRVNQEIDALTTMGLDPVKFLVTTRVIAALLMTPLLSLFAMLVGMLGGAFTMLSFGVPFITFIKEVDGIVNFQDFMVGWVKSFAFAVAIAGIGSLRGLQTSAGASAVGDSATRAVVSGLVLIVIIDGVFAVIYFFLDI